MERCRTAKKITMYVQRSLKRRTKENPLLETVARSGSQEMKEEDSSYDGEPAASSTLSNKGRTPMSRLIEEMTSFCSFFDVNFKHMAEEQKICTNEYRTGKVEVVLAEHRYPDRRD